ncbi:MAG: hypothetical protein ACSNEK_03600 [Parachlamydiaceae bacterium]
MFYRQALSQATWVRYMKLEENCAYNKKVEEAFKMQPSDKTASQEEPDSLGRPLEDESKEKRATSKGSKMINFRVLVGKTKNLTTEQQDQFDLLIKNLISQIYGRENFYREIEQKNPNFLDALLSTLKGFATEKIENMVGLNKLDLKDPDLQRFWYFLLKRNPDERKGGRECSTISFYDFLSEGKKTQVRAFLAPKEILLAFFRGDEIIVNQILEKRMELYDLVDKDYPLLLATQDFQNAFQGYAEFPDILDFTVTKTKPSKS